MSGQRRGNARAGVWAGALGGMRAAAQARRLFLWLPVFFGIGLLAYFAADREPWLWAPAAAIAIFAAGAWQARRAGARVSFRICLALAFLFAGFFAGCLRTAQLAGPVLARTLTGEVTAYVETLDPRQGGARLLLRPVSIAGADAAQWPVRIRVNMRSTPDFEAGATIRATMRLLPPPRPSEPGGYDFARDAWFQQIGAVGSISGIARRAEGAQTPWIAPWIARFNAAVDRARNRLTSRIIEVIGGPQGAVAAALVTGKRGTIPEETNEALRAAGIYHVVSISGLHMVLAAGVFLWSLRALLALFPAFALTRPIKTIAAVFAMAGSIAYCIFAGAEVATERALIMTLIMLGAVVFARPALSMRNLALAALLVMSLEPHTILGPSFQMSFAAVAAMIALFEQRPGRTESGRLMPLGGESGVQNDPHADRRATWSGRMLAMMLALSATTLIASDATGPYGAYHFHRFAPFGLLGNLLALPVVEFIVMPAAVFGTLATAFGLDAPVWTVMGYGVELMLRAARWVASLQGAQVHLKAFGASALLAMSFSLLWASLWLTPLRWFAIAPAVAGVSLAMHTPRPDIMIDRQGRTLAFRTAEGTLAVMNARANRFGVSQWLASDADDRKSDDANLQRGANCDRMGCTAILPGGRVLALTLDRRALSDDCSRADILVTPFFVRDICKGPEKLIDGTYLQTSGALEIFIAQDGALHPRHTRVPGYDRPWSPAPRQNASTIPPPQTLNAQPQALPDEGWTRPQ